MNYTLDNITNTILIENITKDELDLDKTLNCGQAFRWNKDTNNNWIGVVDNKIWILKQYNNYILTNIEYKDKDKLIYYFNLDMKYTDEIGKLDLDNYAKKAYDYGKGIHILRQDLFETMVTFLMSQFNSMYNIRLIVNKLSERYGNKLEYEWFNTKVVQYTFPTLEQLTKCSYDDFINCSIGLRTKYLLSMINYINNNYDILNKLKNCDYKTSIHTLKSFDGIGDKVANCISLFSLHHIEAFPIDVHIKRIIDEEYNGSIDISRYKQYAGIIQQYMYYYRAFNK